jgi:hypothetical protein
MSKSSESVKNWRKKAKEIILVCMGEKCQICNYNNCSAALELHHIDPNEKELSLSSIMTSCKSWNFIYSEIEKCILLCSNCHREVHYNNKKLPIEFKKFDKELANSLRSKNSLAVQRTEENIIKKEYKFKKSKERKEEKLLSIEDRKKLIIDSNIDLTKWGKNVKVGELLGITPQKAAIWLKRHNMI